MADQKQVKRNMAKLREVAEELNEDAWMYEAPRYDPQ